MASWAGEREEPSIVEVLRGGMTEQRPERLGIQHLEARDDALAALDHARKCLTQLERIEAGPSQGSASPRHHEIRKLGGDISAIARRLDQTYR